MVLDVGRTVCNVAVRGGGIHKAFVYSENLSFLCQIQDRTGWLIYRQML